MTNLLATLVVFTAFVPGEASRRGIAASQFLKALQNHRPVVPHGVRLAPKSVPQAAAATETSNVFIPELDSKWRRRSKRFESMVTEDASEITDTDTFASSTGNDTSPPYIDYNEATVLGKLGGAEIDFIKYTEKGQRVSSQAVDKQVDGVSPWDDGSDGSVSFAAPLSQESKVQVYRSRRLRSLVPNLPTSNPSDDWYEVPRAVTDLLYEREANWRNEMFALSLDLFKTMYPSALSSRLSLQEEAKKKNYAWWMGMDIDEVLVNVRSTALQLPHLRVSEDTVWPSTVLEAGTAENAKFLPVELYGDYASDLHTRVAIRSARERVRVNNLLATSPLARTLTVQWAAPSDEDTTYHRLYTSTVIEPMANGTFPQFSASPFTRPQKYLYHLQASAGAYAGLKEFRHERRKRRRLQASKVEIERPPQQVPRVPMIDPVATQSFDTSYTTLPVRPADNSAPQSTMTRPLTEEVQSGPTNSTYRAVTSQAPTVASLIGSFDVSSAEFGAPSISPETKYTNNEILPIERLKAVREALSFQALVNPSLMMGTQLSQPATSTETASPTVSDGSESSFFEESVSTEPIPEAMLLPRGHLSPLSIGKEGSDVLEKQLFTAQLSKTRRRKLKTLYTKDSPEVASTTSTSTTTSEPDSTTEPIVELRGVADDEDVPYDPYKISVPYCDTRGMYVGNWWFFWYCRNPQEPPKLGTYFDPEAPIPAKQRGRVIHPRVQSVRNPMVYHYPQADWEHYEEDWKY